MTDPRYILVAVLISASITWGLRALPFAMLAPLRDSRLLAYLGDRMPAGIMFILAAYTLRETEPTVPASAGPAVLALVVTVGLQLWRGSMTLSIFAGTALYVAMASVIAA
ncbi:branched-chain amino acid transporter permease [Gordonia hydrophobica]|uniref:AzlD domain-containing protein n=1 Tax=Gordonia hydrophobica TaxID=40516 RepID=A0ABZ2U5K1_9ACTN|nr:AzlD domain-containing protein [Gordonia hydrophobica]MBM7365713.1 branched-subunit amino acid transport protein AzlD [Gordonia hydrophobica]